MNLSKLRRQIAWEAARLMYSRQESEYYRAKQKAARQICRSWVKPADLPSNAEIRDQIQLFARLHEGDARSENLQQMRIEGLRMLRLLARFKPRIIGSTLTGFVRKGSDIDIHVFSDSIEAVCALLEGEGMVFDVERKRVRKDGEERIFTHIHIQDQFPIELTVYASNLAHYVFKSSVTGKAIERASLAEFEAVLETAYPDMDLSQAVDEAENRIDRFQLYESLLLPLENVKQHRKYHPEGDALYHSLQVFDLARDELPYDEEFLLAALLHDVGKGIDADDHVLAGLEALDGFISERTEWLIRHHMDAHKIHDGTLGARAKRRLRESDSYEDLLLLSECDHAGRQPGVQAPELDEALDYLRELARMCG
ncbi:MAG: HD domain-containing protein [Planctomycetales bacterium]|nr:HD domain-containing protein [Planctomycetales bacterium]